MAEEIRVNELKEGIWYITKEDKQWLCKRLEDLPKAIVTASIIPYKYKVCDEVYKMLMSSLGDEGYIEMKRYLKLTNLIEFLVDALIKCSKKEEDRNEKVQ